MDTIRPDAIRLVVITEDEVMRVTPTAYAKFHPGEIAVTQAVAQELNPEEVFFALIRHLEGDWGSVDEHDRKENEVALEHGFRLLSMYESKNGVKFWIITEADRSSTTVLLPSDY